MRTCSIRKRILVTGGAGFIGLHLCERLLARMVGANRSGSPRSGTATSASPSVRWFWRARLPKTMAPVTW